MQISLAQGRIPGLVDSRMLFRAPPTLAAISARACSCSEVENVRQDARDESLASRIRARVVSLANAAAAPHLAVHDAAAARLGAACTAANAAMVVNRLNVVAQAKTPTVRMTSSALIGHFLGRIRLRVLGAGASSTDFWELGELGVGAYSQCRNTGKRRVKVAAA